jgi:dipeptidyl aminopeptidase/acylaminoacyl peptidase
MCHGGPTAATSSTLNLKIQFWTSRGFAVLDVNYRGSTGYGRQYRDRLKHNWGVTDVIDVCSGADFFITQGLVDENKLAIRGGSAGGYTVLAALTFSKRFTAGASLYGIGNLETLAQDTHKFEARYLDTLVGIYPDEKALFLARSPLYHIEQLQCPVIFLQGLQDKVVPPNQAEAMVTALTEKGIPNAYVTFPEEGHGFRQAHNIQRAIEAELFFYSKIFGFALAESISPIHITHLEH